jgi:hypothetical protein
MIRYIVTILTVACLCAALGAVAYGSYPTTVPPRNLPILSGDESQQVPQDITIGIGTPNQFATDDYVGEVDTVGWTWDGYQHNGTAGRMIREDAINQIHVAWMNGENSGATNRHVYYNMWSPVSGWSWGSIGTRVESAFRGGYTCLAINQDGYPFPAFHTRMGYGNDHAAVAVDIMPPFGAFQYYECPWLYEGGSDIEIIWPRIAVDGQGHIQLINTENPASGAVGDPQRIYYCRGEFDQSLITFTDQQEICWAMTIAADIAASRHSDRVAFVYTDIRESIDGDTTQYNNDIYLVVSEDGITWDFDDYVNVTDFIYPDTTLLPDTTAANMDTLRAYADASLLFDVDDNIHVAFTTPFYDELRGLVAINNSLIWHWSEDTGYYSLVADGWFGGVPFECGAWQRFVQRPCLAVDESTGDLFCTYQLYDTSDVSAGMYPQGEVYASRSNTGGTYWSQGVNLSNTHNPNAQVGQCYSERDITCNETVSDGVMHMLYVLDLDAGSVTQNPQEGAWTHNPVQYQRVPIAQIPTTPLMPVRPMHVDSTGMPPDPPPAVELVDNEILPSSLRLAQNYPNPFNPMTNLSFDLFRADRVSLKIYNVLGQEVATLVDGRLNAGSYKVSFDATDLASGVYIYQLSTSATSESRKMVLLK